MSPKKKRFTFVITHLCLTFIDKGIFLTIYRNGKKNNFHNIWRVFPKKGKNKTFGMAKIKDSNNNF